MSICYHGFSETPGPSKDCDVCILLLERDRFEELLQKVKSVLWNCIPKSGDHWGRPLITAIDDALLRKPIEGGK
jgi:hypothetical protein